ncbi:hypothetical protein K469DRAFT_695449 [Zopfia rhizophila CBS 207.26]|uniref:Clr5 domain-containing protein n=1 Tax=Zopfia rhizophila CBS 207.26 TaxID=1314779 RepID=A0A6A6DGL8_9PEZI|nr:hypothetical protein K469DRAFT_695449 [Zopfia rhizophila CBS 207.26]
MSIIVKPQVVFLIKSWYHPRSGRPPINLNNYQLEIATLFHEGLTFEQITKHLYKQYNLNVNLRTIKRRFRNWRIVQRLPTEVEKQVKKRIQVLFFKVGLEDEDMLCALENKGFQIRKYTLI